VCVCVCVCVCVYNTLYKIYIYKIQYIYVCNYMHHMVYNLILMIIKYLNQTHFIALKPRKMFLGEIFHLALEFTIHFLESQESNHPMKSPTFTLRSLITAHLRKVSFYKQTREEFRFSRMNIPFIYFFPLFVPSVKSSIVT